MEKFTKLIKESKSIFHLCDEYDNARNVLNQQIEVLDKKHKEPLLKMIILLLESYSKVNNTNKIDWEEDIDNDDYIYIGEIAVTHIIDHGGNDWHIQGYGFHNNGGEFEGNVGLDYAKTDDLSEFLRGLLEEEKIMSCYSFRGVKNINKE
tara:strand:- start:68088 stop:68537 length:450 start_codon:yes stop_codon:yes gene_type:complete